MSIQPVHHDPDPRVPRTIDGIAAALSGARRMAFYREVGQAQAGEELQHVVATWWGEAMLGTDPDGERVIAAANAGTLPTVSWDQIHRRRRERGGEMPGE
ncbi:hypothetical protein ACFV84_35060 [Kitasatospora sp. NPDC059811]|uniref:hypothetical protein n=1 Tax=Streptomycetaceae TaxID=2062 RepID=UPI00099FD330|nr:hypothetical protein [Streptomyces sp. MJM8645]